MSVWLTIPSARPPEQANTVMQKWRDQGYKIALFLDNHDFYDRVYDRVLVGKYPGYAQAVNLLIKDVAYMRQDAEWFVIGGDDTSPDPNKRADEIAQECTNRFSQIGFDATTGKPLYGHKNTFGVMQPTGDPFAGRQIERICGSPWIGRDFALRINQGIGPLWPEYQHMFVDEEIQEVAKKYGVLWQRRDLCHHHEHWTRNGDVADYSKPLPAFLREANSPEHWKKYGDIFRARKQAGFPGSEPLVSIAA